MDVGGGKEGGREYVRAAEANQLLAPATHATETFKSFWRQKERCGPLREPKLDSRAGSLVPSYPPFIQKEPLSLASRVSLPLPLPRPPPPPALLPPMFVLQSLNHLRSGRVLECVSCNDEEGRRLAGYRPRTASSTRLYIMRRSSTAPNSPANRVLYVARMQGSDSLVPSFPRSLFPSPPPLAVAVQYDHVLDSGRGRPSLAFDCPD